MRNTKLAVIADLLGSIGALIVLGYGGWLVIKGQMGVGTLVAFNAYIAFVFPPIVRFVDLATIFQRAIVISPDWATPLWYSEYSLATCANDFSKTGIW